MSLCCMVNSFLNARPHCAGQSSSHTKSPVIQDLHGYLEALTDLTNNVFHWHWSVFEVDLCCVRALDAHLLLWGSMRHTTECTFHNESRHLKRVKSMLVLVLFFHDLALISLISTFTSYVKY